MKLPALRPRQPFVGLALAAIAGIVGADYVELPLPWVFGATVVAVLLVLFRPGAFTCWILCAALFFELHTIRHWKDDARSLAAILAQGPRVVSATGIVCREPEKPATWSGKITCRFVLKLESLSRGKEALPMNALMNVSWVGPIPVYGDRVTLTGGASNLDPTRNPGEFDYVSYQHRRGVFSEIRTRYANDCQIAAHRQGNPLIAFGFVARHWVEARLNADLADSPEATEVIDGIVLGLRGESPEDLKVLLQRTGTIHLFVVSGLNIAMLGYLAFLLLRPLGLPRVLVISLVILILWTYALITGFRTASVRSATMVTIFSVAGIFDRRALSFNTLAAAAFVILLNDTNELFAPGFQFSFSVVFVIIACAAPLERRIERLAHADPFLPRVLWSWPLKCAVRCWHVVCVTLGVLLASWIGSLLFTVGYFHLFSPGSLIANLVAVPLAFCILALGVASLLVTPISSSLVVHFNNANWFMAKVMLQALHLSSIVPGGWLYVERPTLAVRPKCEICVLDLGEGGVAHVRAGGCDWLLDCGNDTPYNRVVLPYLRSQGVNNLTGLLLTHGSAPDIGAAHTAIGDFRPRFLAESMLTDRSTTRKKLHATLVEEHRGKGLYTRDDFIRLGKAASLRVLYPPTGLKRNVAADKALVLQLQCGATRALFMSSSGFDTEQWLLENERDLQSDIVIKGQRSGDISGTPDFLARVAPRAVVCAGLTYAQPIEELDAWEKDTSAQGITVFRQDKTGAVQIAISDDGFEVRGFVNGQTFRIRAR